MLCERGVGEGDEMAAGAPAPKKGSNTLQSWWRINKM